jgi:hypothetical protein
MKNVLLTFFLGLTALLNAQNYVRQVLIINEGYQDYQTLEILVPVTIGSYDPVTQQYISLDTLEGMRFASDAVIAGDAYFVAADQNIYKFDLNTHQQLAEVTFPGVRNLAFSDGKLVASRGEYLTTYDSYLHVFNASDLSLVAAIDTVTGPKWATQNLIADGNIVYVAVNNGYELGNEKGLIGRLDMTNLTYGNEVDLGPDGKNPDNMVLHNGYLYTVNNKDWSGASISRVSLDGSSNSTVNIATAITGCGTSALRDNRIVYQVSGENVLNEFETVLMNNVGPIAGFNEYYYELVQNPVTGELYTSVTDYSTFGEVRIYDNSNSLIHTFSVGVSPGTIVFDVQPLSAIGEKEINDVSLFPNPVNDELRVEVNANATLHMTDLMGKVVLISHLNAGSGTVNVDSLPSGSYICTTLFEDGSQSVRKITKN